MTNNLPLVSVIVPTHNRPDFLQKTLESILLQSYKNMEIIVVSNGVNNCNKEVVVSLNDERLLYFDQENSGGPSAPRNHGILKAKGKYIAFCDDDDLWMCDKVQKQVIALENNPEYGLCYTKMLRFDYTKEWTNSNEEATEADLNSLLYVNTVPISSVFLRRDLIDKLGSFSGSKKIGPAEDYEFLLRYVCKTTFYYIDEYLIKYWSGDNRTTKLDGQSIKEQINYIKCIYWCYFFLCQNAKISKHMLIRPFMYHVYLASKIIIFQKLKGKK